MATSIYIIPVIGITALIYSFVKYSWEIKQDVGDDKMMGIDGYIREGTIAFLKTEYKILFIFVLAVALLLVYANGSSIISYCTTD